MKVYWTEDADRDRAQIYDYIAQDNLDAAVRLDQTFSAAAQRLAEFPFLGRRGILPETRELHPHENYRLVYDIRDDEIFILTIIHTSRQWPLQ
ncbi:type II toxin-antitoxin system RelE/ParE family toxin [Acidisoma cellulosilytica]|uniref:Type II toxin-antitoxin system RelE/ParE family toxin n=1 Tax=Acidisoma cellulosilyticum TaxID=2802395 RepID=A0A964E6D9_9PROT|nr:type II toxin-antitoxin system RelE/ParE family toxin [Acidisoma cellulosilyticum]MCB8883484.1 type II toxin-antitoxin system RelE/ParE family toxin [Acidisoma cellulosilyticum]